MKQTLAVAGLSLLVGLVPLSFVSQTASAIDLPILNDQVSAAKRTVDDTVSTGKSEIAHQARQSTNSSGHGSGDNGNAHSNSGGKKADDDASSIPEQRFTANKLRGCERRQVQIISNISAISDRGAKQLDVFHSIAERTKAFYAAKGYSLPTYDSLAASVDSLYDKSLVAVNTTQSSGESWSCNGSNPTVQLQQFKQAKQAEITTLAEYKNKVHELLVLVKSAATSSTQSTGGTQ